VIVPLHTKFHVNRTTNRGNIAKRQHGGEQRGLVTLTFDLLTLKVVSDSHVTWATSVPILVFLGLSILDYRPGVRDRHQTDVCRVGAGA